MPSRNPASAYKDQAVQTANKPQLLVMLCDRMAADISRAELAIEMKDYESANNNLQHAQRIVRMLSSSLDPNGFKGGHELLAVYNFLERHLIKANFEKNPELVRECADLFRPIHEAWRIVVSANEDSDVSPDLD